MSFISVMTLEGQDDLPRAEQGLVHWRIRIDSELELDVEFKQGIAEEPDHSRPFLIPNGSRVLTLIVNNGEIIEKIYQTPNEEKISVKC
ncbi:MAG TPA: hypothetical protein QF700_04015 [Prochlorococcus sp.]|nr:hypothetical protein [Prochlorococcus sp.]